ncbi:MAG: hypothetical protein DBW62_00635 [Microbacterium sp.]|nr:MAG: hypothetical protein DBW62_00635 [Microbacterium sp.]
MTAPEDLIKSIVEPVLTQLRSGDLASIVFEGDVDEDPERYVNVYHDIGNRASRTIVDEVGDVTVTFWVHSVGRERWQAVWCSDLVTLALHKFRPTISGRTCFPMRHIGGQPIKKDDSVAPPRQFGVDMWELHTTLG